METFIKRSDDVETVNVNFMPPLLDAILGDYNRNVPAARDAEVLNVMATIINRLGVSRFWCGRICMILSAIILAFADATGSCYP